MLLVVPFLFLPFGCGGCGGQQSDSLVIVGVHSLVRDYRDFPTRANDAWNNRRVRVLLYPKDYTPTVTGIYWYDRVPSDTPTVMFECTSPSDNTLYAEITGICLGVIHDGIDRGPNGLRGYIKIVQCSVVYRQTPD
jgi:hypothetical protein